MSNENPFSASASQAHSGPAPPALQDLGIAVGLALATFVLGGYLSGMAIDKFGSPGTISLWATGGIVGFLAAKLIRPSKVAGYILAGGVVLAFVASEICWIHWNIVGAETWPAAIGMFPTFLQDASVDALIGGIFTFFGAASAYRQAGVRYRYVRVVDA